MKKIALQFNKITTYFMRTFLLCILMGFIILFIFLIKVRLNADNSKFKPTRQVDSSWICANPNIEFTVKEGKCFRELKLNEKTVNVKVLFGPGLDYSMTVNDYDAIVINDFKYDSKTELFSGDCKFSEKCVVTITESHIDSLKVDDKITFNRVEELPDWAKETELLS